MVLKSELTQNHLLCISKCWQGYQKKDDYLKVLKSFQAISVTCISIFTLALANCHKLYCVRKVKTEQCLFNLCSNKYSSVIKPWKQPEFRLCSLLSDKPKMGKHGNTEWTDSCEPDWKEKLRISNIAFISISRMIFFFFFFLNKTLLKLKYL